MDDQAASTLSRTLTTATPGAGSRTDARARDRRQPFVAGAVYTAATIASLTAGATVGATTRLSLPSAGVLALGLVLTVLATWGEPVRRAATLWAWLLTALASTCLVLLATTALPVRPYGDGAMFAQFVADGRVVPRWLVGNAAAGAAHAAVWEMPAVRAWLPEALRSSSAFLALLGSTVMVVGTWGLFRRWPGQLSVLLPALTPVWVLFASGYVEYYPLVAVPFVAVLAWVFERPLEDRTVTQVAAVGGLLPLLYVGFLPTGLCVLTAYIAVHPARASRTAAAAAGLAAIAIAVCWPDGAASYFRTLYAVMNFGDANLPPQYEGQVAGPTSLMFSVEAVQSWVRTREVLYLMVWGGGWLMLPLLPVAAGATWISLGQDRRPALRDVRPWLGAALVGWHVYYLVFMVPRLGPTADIDLFFPTYLTLAFMVGLLVDRSPAAHRSTWTAAAIACALAALAWAGPWLVWFGLPPVP
jgi:hypothetical protein